MDYRTSEAKPTVATINKKREYNRREAYNREK